MQALVPEKTWFVIDGELETIDFVGPSHFRFPLELASWAIEHFSQPGDVVLDPFCGFGTTVVAAERLGRVGFGIEKDGSRARFAAARVHPPSRVIRASAQQAADLGLAPVDLLFTSPPYTSFRDWDADGFAHYWADFNALFASFAPLVRPDGRIVVEVGNVREADGSVRPLALRAGCVLAEHFHFLGDYVRCNSGGEPAAPGFDHAYLLVFAPRR